LQETAICEEQKESAPFCSRKRKKNNQLLISSAWPAGPLKKALKTRLPGATQKNAKHFSGKNQSGSYKNECESLEIGYY
jgi:hypothetical protein